MTTTTTVFETFTRRAAPVVLQPILTFQRRGVIGLNNAAYEALGSPGEVELLFNREARQVGIRPVTDAVPHAYRVRKQQGSATYLIAARAFMQFFDIPSEVAQRYEAVMRDGMLIADLGRDEAPVIAGGQS